MSTTMLQMHQMFKITQDQTKNHQVNVVNQSCDTCGGPHPYYECPSTGSYAQENVYAANMGGNGYPPLQGDRNLLSYRPSQHHGPPGFNQPNQVNQNNTVQNRNHQFNNNQNQNR